MVLKYKRIPHSISRLKEGTHIGQVTVNNVLGRKDVATCGRRRTESTNTECTRTRVREGRRGNWRDRRVRLFETEKSYSESHGIYLVRGLVKEV